VHIAMSAITMEQLSEFLAMEAPEEANLSVISL
jgi:hypothetical protein